MSIKLRYPLPIRRNEDDDDETTAPIWELCVAGKDGD